MTTTKLFCKITAIILLLQMCFSLASCDALQILENLTGKGDNAVPDENNGQEKLTLPDEVFFEGEKYGYEFKIERKNGKCYINFADGNGKQHTGEYYVSGCIGYIVILNFSSVEEMIDTIKTGDFGYNYIRVVHACFPRDENGIFLPDPDTVRLPKAPHGVNTSSVCMYGDSYYFSVAPHNVNVGPITEEELEKKLDAFANFEEAFLSGRKNPLYHMGKLDSNIMRFGGVNLQINAVEKAEDGSSVTYEYSYEDGKATIKGTAQTRIAKNNNDTIYILEMTQNTKLPEYPKPTSYNRFIMCFGYIDGDRVHAMYDYTKNAKYVEIFGESVPDKIVDTSPRFNDEYWLTLGFEK